MKEIIQTVIGAGLAALLLWLVWCIY